MVYDFISIKGINVNRTHIQERLTERSTTRLNQKLVVQIGKIIDFLSRKRAVLTKGMEWEVNVGSFKAVGDGLNWRTVLKKGEHNSRSVIFRWNV
jgi:hypothetical protein